MEFYFLELPSYISLVICGFVGLIFLAIHFSKFELSFNFTLYLPKCITSKNKPTKPQIERLIYEGNSKK